MKIVDYRKPPVKLTKIEKCLPGTQYEEDSKYDVAVVDIDFHDVPPGNPERLKYIYPSPDFYQKTKRGGFHLFYVRDMNYNAYQKAAFAVFSAWKEFNPSGVDVLTKFACYEEIQPFRKTKFLEKASMFNTFAVSAAEVAEYKENKNFVYGQRLHKSSCPSGEHDDGFDTNKALVIKEAGVYCHRCVKFFPYVKMLHSDRISNIEVAARCKWPYAWAELEFNRLSNLLEIGKMPENHYRTIYEVMLDARHPNCPFLELCFPSRDLNLYRTTDKMWVNRFGEVYTNEVIKKAIRRLPFLYTVREKEDKKTGKKELLPIGRCFDEDKSIEYLSNDTTIEDIPLVEVIYGYNIKTKRVGIYKQNHYDIYIKPRNLTKSIGIDSAFDLLEKILGDKIPRANSMQIAASSMYSQFCDGIRPLLVATGVSGSGKTFLSRIIGHILGIKVTSLPTVPKKTEYDAAFGEALHNGSRIIVVDEGLKYAKPEFFLQNDSNEYDYRRLYVGQVHAINKATTILNGIHLPESYENNKQFLRRAFLLPRLHRQANWNFSRLRAETKDLKTITTTIVEFFREFLPVEKGDYENFQQYWDDIKTMLPESCQEAGEYNTDTDTTGQLKTFIEKLQAENCRYSGNKYRNWHVIQKDLISDPSWLAFCELFPAYTGKDLNLISENDFLQEQPWGEILGLEKFDIKMRSSSSKIYVCLKSKGKII